MPSLADLFAGKSPLPDRLPADPFPIVAEWFAEALARKDQPNPDAMTLATADAEGRPSARMVLCRGIEPADGSIVFFTNYRSRKGRELETNPRAAAVFFWDHLDRQVRVEGVVTRTTDAESDTYFASRRWESRVGAWASEQSQPIAGRAALIDKVLSAVGDLGLSVPALVRGGASVDIPRPPHWGGYRIHAAAVECWVSGIGRIHDRARWERTIETEGEAIKSGVWSATRLQP